MKKILINMKICAHFVYYEDLKEEINNISETNNDSKILILYEDINFPPLFHNYFNQYAKKLSKNKWEVVKFNNLGIAFNN